MILSAPVAAQDGGSGAVSGGEAAFRDQDFTTAVRLWRDEAATGSTKAMLGLGLVYDLGLGVGRDPATALRWYLEAAGRGLAEAQFNVGVMLDSGIGLAREPTGAAIWYARAAANGNTRAQYNLGLLYEAGIGVPRNGDLARTWLSLAAPTLTAARERGAKLVSPPPDMRQMVAPVPLSGSMVETAEGPRAELVWSSGPGPEGTSFVLEIAGPATGTQGPALLTQQVQTSAVSLMLDGGRGASFWRVSRVDASGRHYAPSPWQNLAPSDPPGAPPSAPSGAPPEGRVHLIVAQGDGPAQRLADDLAQVFSTTGLSVTREETEGAAEGTTVSYSYAEDADLAGAIAGFLPALRPEDARDNPVAGTPPGEVRVRLVGGPALTD